MTSALLGALLALVSVPADAGAAVEPSLPADPPTVPCSDPRGCPDLIVDPSSMAPALREQTFHPLECDVKEGSTQPGRRSLLRFTFTSPNLGPGDLVVGRPSMHPGWFEYHPCHAHYHFREYADYRLWTRKGFATWDALRRAHPTVLPAELLAEHPELASELTVGEKEGFCIIDVRQYDPLAPGKYSYCDHFQGISAGWADEYNEILPGQYLDVTDVKPGDYVLEEEVNPERLFDEADYTNNRGSVDVHLPGPDLVVTSTDIEVGPGPGPRRSVTITVRNVGERAAEAVQVKLLDGATELGRPEVAHLPAGESRTVTVAWDSQGTRRRTLTVVADPSDSIAELEEANNVASIEVDLRP